VAPIITGITVHFRFHIRCISIHKRLYFNFLNYYHHYYYYENSTYREKNTIMALDLISNTAKNKFSKDVGALDGWQEATNCTDHTHTHTHTNYPTKSTRPDVWRPVFVCPCATACLWNSHVMILTDKLGLSHGQDILNVGQIVTNMTMIIISIEKSHEIKETILQNQ
jgi:hypothetical protein